MAAGSEETSILVIRVWRENSAFRARVTVAPDLSSPDQWSVVVGTPDELIAAITDWISTFAAKRPVQRPDRR